MSAEIVNKTTGECLLTDSYGREYRLLFTLRAVAQIESARGESVMSIVSRLVGVTDLAVMIVAGSAAAAQAHANGAKPINQSRVLDVIRDCGSYRGIVDVVTESLCRGEGMGLFPDDEAESDEPPPLVPPSN